MLEKNGYLLRLGKHSGAKALTIEGYRKTRVRTREGFEDMCSPKNLWLAFSDPMGSGSLRPFGWAVLKEGV